MSVLERLKLESESYSVEGTITSVTSTATGTTANVTGKAGHYGKVYLTYNFVVNPKHETQGSVTGIGRAITDDGESNEGTRNGVWTRDGHIMTVYSLDDVSDGQINLCVETWDFRDDSVKFEFSRVQK
ncbi:MAG: hypothetical protein VX427_13325 [Acidobacteriota bacterium]|nr:hypothetical protein [Acidobacteriota bacterium]